MSGAWLRAPEMRVCKSWRLWLGVGVGVGAEGWEVDMM